MRPTVTGCRFSCDRRAQSSSATSTRGERRSRASRAPRGRASRSAESRKRCATRRRSRLRPPSGRNRRRARAAGRDRSRREHRARGYVFTLPEHVLDAIEQIAFVLRRRRAGAARTSPSAAPWRAVRADGAAPCVSFFGVCTWTVANRSPRPRPFTSGMPLPRSRSVVPVCVPSGTFTLSAPSSVGT